MKALRALPAVLAIALIPACHRHATAHEKKESDDSPEQLAESSPAVAPEPSPAAEPAEKKSKLSDKEEQRAYELLGGAQGCDFVAKLDQETADEKRDAYESAKRRAVSAVDLMDAQDARDEWKKAEAKVEEDKREAREKREEAKRILGDEYPKDDGSGK